MKKRIFRNMCLIAIIAVVLCTLSILSALYSFFNAEIVKELRTQAKYLTTALNKEVDKETYLSSVGYVLGESRITLIGKDGVVLFDSYTDISKMDNHSTRPEVVEALTNGVGEETRISSTLSEKTTYYAVLLEDGSVIRLANTRKSAFGVLLSLLAMITMIALAVLIIAFILAKPITKSIIRPINSLDLEKPLDNEVYEELSPLLAKISRLNNQIKQQLAQMQGKQNEFETISENMMEGLILLDSKANVLTINKSALTLLKVKNGSNLHQSIWTLCRRLQFQDTVKIALSGVRCEQTIEEGDIHYHLFANPIVDGKVVKGVILLLVDVTERYKTEQMRREFSANVSHELKTPLTSISGNAEMLAHGMVKPEDVESFAGKIHQEAQHLIELVEDIIKISSLDEKRILLTKEDVNLKTVATSVVERLCEKAQAAKVAISLSSDDAFVKAIPRMIDELIYNFCDNAIKYNKPGGTVNVTICSESGIPIIEVADTGIGIPKQHQDRVFERFYRVDKSHSKLTGGTGLGLSIVKHIAEYHHAKIELQSAENFGTSIKVLFVLDRK